MASTTDATIHWTNRKHRKKTTRQRTYNDLATIFCDIAQIIRPPARLTVSQSAEKFIYLNNPGSYIGPYRLESAPYMKEPMDMLTSRRHAGLAFVGPAQSSKTESLILGFVAHTVCSDPMDLIIYNPSTAMARDFSMRRIDRLHRNSPEVGKLLLTDRDSDNKFDKHYRSGMMVTLSWPTVNEMSGRPIGRVMLTDYDRMDDDIEGDGAPFDLASKRTQTFGSFAMTAAESSPSKPVKNRNWIKKTPHEAPPCDGIFSLYNRGDRRRWYWPCPQCGEYFEGTWRHLEYDTKGSNKARSKTVRMVCPICKEHILPAQRTEMQAWGIWLKDGQQIDSKTGRIHGKTFESDIASFWLNGVAAGFSTWEQLVSKFLDAQDDFERTGSETALQKFYNTDLAEPYMSKAADVMRLPEIYKERAENLPVMETESNDRIIRLTNRATAIEPMVPEGVRCLLACVDVQKNMFVVQVHGVLPGNPFDLVVIDRFQVRASQRLDANGDQEWVKPGVYLDDWEELTSAVLHRTYMLCDGSGRRMGIKMTLCDSGGHSKTTTNAYAYYRSLKARNEAGRFHLVKGEPSPNGARTRISFPDSNRRDKLAAARGDVPVLLMNSNELKDALVNRLECMEPGKGMFRYPKWLPDWWFAEMAVEIRTEKGWESPSHKRNEGFDLSYYAIAGCISVLLRIEQVPDWNNTVNWLSGWDTNSFVIAAEVDAKEPFALREDSVYDFSKLGKTLAGT